MSELATLQRWLTSIIVRPGALPEKIRAADSMYDIDHTRVIRSSPELSGPDRIHIYARGYVLRLMECLRAEYPVLRNLLGEELFDMFAHAYLAHRPSGSYTLFDLGSSFPAFLAASRPRQFSSGDEQKKYDLPVELALLERARAEVYRSPGTEGREETDPDGEAMFFFMEQGHIRVSPCLRLLTVQFPLIDFIKAVERGEQPPVPPVQQTFVAVSRKNYTVHMRELEAWQWYFLKATGETGSLTQAAAVSAAQSGRAEEVILADLMLWLPVAFGLGYLYRA